MQNWPADAAGRRAKMIEMTTADASWPQRPVDPDLCMVCDDIIAIMQNLINQQGGSGQDTTPPTTVATANPGPNVNGWNLQDGGFPGRVLPRSNSNSEPSSACRFLSPPLLAGFSYFA